MPFLPRAAGEGDQRVEPGSALEKWVEWALQQAARLDPTKGLLGLTC